MKRLLLAGLLALAIPMAFAGSAFAASPNKQTIHATCNGQPITVQVNEHSNNNAAAPVEGGGSIKLVEAHFFLAGTSTEAFSFTTNYPKAPNVTCTGSFVDPGSGDTFDFVVTGVLRPGK